MSKKVNSHKQLPKFLLKRFSERCISKRPDGGTNKKYFVKILDIKTLQITERDITKVGTEYGYFNEKNEEYLSKKEKSFSDFLSKIDEWEKTGGYFDLRKYEKLLMDFTKLTIVRSSNILDEVKKKSLFGSMLKSIDEKKYNEIFSQDKLLEIFKKITLSSLDEILSNYEINLMVNTTDVPFCISNNIWYSIRQKGESQIILPIDEKKAIILYESKYKERYRLESGLIGFQVVSNSDSINNLNLTCLASAVNTQGEFIACSNISVLELLKAQLELL